MTDKKDELKPLIVTNKIRLPDKIVEKGTRDVVRDDIDRSKPPTIPPIVKKTGEEDEK